MCKIDVIVGVGNSPASLVHVRFHSGNTVVGLVLGQVLGRERNSYLKNGPWLGYGITSVSRIILLSKCNHFRYIYKQTAYTNTKSIIIWF